MLGMLREMAAHAQRFDQLGGDITSSGSFPQKVYLYWSCRGMAEFALLDDSLIDACTQVPSLHLHQIVNLFIYSYVLSLCDTMMCGYFLHTHLGKVLIQRRVANTKANLTYHCNSSSQGLQFLSFWFCGHS
jgi:hypothetical protein